jgi:tripartite-type tricarboxylate transporter receptor subunit TctC
MTRLTFVLVLGGFAAASTVQAQEYPSKPIRWIVPYAPGSSTDTVSRLLAPELSRRMKQPVVVENRPGGGGMVGGDVVAKAAPDGYTIGMMGSSVIAGAVYTYKTPAFSADDLTPITQVFDGHLILAATAQLPPKGFNEIMAYAKANPGKLNFGSVGGDPQIYGEMIKAKYGVDIVHVPFKGAGLQLESLLRNDIQIAFHPVFTLVPHVKAGKLNIVAVSGDKRAAAFPDAPTFGEVGVSGLRNFSQAVFGPKGLPAPIVARLNTELVEAIRSAEVTKRLEDMGLNPIASQPAYVRTLIDSIRREWGEIVQRAGIKPE